MKNSPSIQARARLVVLDLIAFVAAAAGIGLVAALAFAGVVLLFSGSTEAALPTEHQGPAAVGSALPRSHSASER